jgi:sortase A
MKRGFLARYGELLLLVAGIAFLTFAGFQRASYMAFQKRPEWFAGTASGATAASSSDFWLSPATAERRPLGVAGKLDAPSVGLSVFVVDNDDYASLALGPGHVAGSAPIGAFGNAVIAGHRDMAFRALRDIKVGAEVRIRSSETFIYKVSSIRIVSPEDISVLSSAPGEAKLTLITCYPFHYVGDAPSRFVVQANLVRD